MKNLPQTLCVATVVAVSVIFSPLVKAVSDEDFNTLKSEVDQMNKKMQEQEQTNQQDKEKIQDLEKQLDATQKVADDAQQKAEAAQPPPSPPPSATHNFMMVGDAEFQFGRTTGQHGTFAQTDFAPVFLYRANDNILFEAGFDFVLQNGGLPDGGTNTSVSLTFAQLDYLYNDYVTLVAGEMLLPLGTYTERNAGWLNKIPDSPLARNFLPSTSPGVQLRGSVPIGESGQQVTYSIYGVNGPSAVDGVSGNSTTLNSAGNQIPNLDLGGNAGDTSNPHDPTGGGRLGWLYVFKPHYDFEIGASGQSGVWDNASHRGFTAAVADASLHIGSDFELKGEYIRTWEGTDDLGTIRPNGWWVQGAYKLSGLNIEAPLINNVELVGRYDAADDGLGTKTDRYTAGGIYYFTNTFLFEGDYEFLNSTGPNALPSSDLILQLSYGF